MHVEEFKQVTLLATEYVLVGGTALICLPAD